MESAAKSEQPKPVSILEYWAEAIFFLVAMLLVGVSVYHQSLIGDLNAYRSRPVLMIESLLLVVAGLCLLIQGVRTVIALVMSRFPFAFQRFGVALLLLLAIVFFVWFDMETLMYAT